MATPRSKGGGGDHDRGRKRDRPIRTDSDNSRTSSNSRPSKAPQVGERARSNTSAHGSQRVIELSAQDDATTSLAELRDAIPTIEQDPTIRTSSPRPMRHVDMNRTYDGRAPAAAGSESPTMVALGIGRGSQLAPMRRRGFDPSLSGSEPAGSQLPMFGQLDLLPGPSVQGGSREDMPASGIGRTTTVPSMPTLPQITNPGEFPRPSRVNTASGIGQYVNPYMPSRTPETNLVRALGFTVPTSAPASQPQEYWTNLPRPPPRIEGNPPLQLPRPAPALPPPQYGGSVPAPPPAVPPMQLPPRRGQPLTHVPLSNEDRQRYPVGPRPHPYAQQLAALGWNEPEVWQYWRTNPCAGKRTSPGKIGPSRQRVIEQEGSATQTSWFGPLPYERWSDYIERIDGLGYDHSHERDWFYWREVNEPTLANLGKSSPSHEERRRIRKEKLEALAAEKLNPGGIGGANFRGGHGGRGGGPGGGGGRGGWGQGFGGGDPIAAGGSGGAAA